MPFPISGSRVLGGIFALFICLNKTASRLSPARILPAGYTARKPAHLLLENPISKKPLSPLPANPAFRRAMRTFLFFARTGTHCAAPSQNKKRAENKKAAPYLRGARRIPERVPVACAREIGKRRLPRIALPFFMRANAMAAAPIVAQQPHGAGNLGESDLEPTAAPRFRPAEKRTGVFKARGIKLRIRIAGIFAYFVFEVAKRSPAPINSIRPLVKTVFSAI